MTLPWKRLAKRLRIKCSADSFRLHQRSNRIATLTKERDELVRLNESYAKTIGALRIAVETLLLNPDSRLGAGITHGGPPNASAEPGLTEERKENE